MRAMVLAAGKGQRLRPLTVFWAKPALPVLGRPLIEYALAVLAKAGVREIVVNLHHRAHSLTPILKAAEKGGVHVYPLVETEILGTAGGLKRAQSLLGDGTFLLLNGDTLIDVDLAELVRWHRRRGGEATLLLRPKPTGSEYTPFGLDAKARLVSMPNAKSPPLMFAGLWVLEPRVLDRIPAAGPRALEVEVLPELMHEKAAYGCLRDVAWFDIGTPRRYLTACLKMARHGLFRQLWKVEQLELGGGHSTEPVVLAGAETSLGSEVRFLGEVVLGSGCRVKRAATVQKSVLWDGVVVGEGAVVRNSIITEGVVIPAGSRIENKMVLRHEGGCGQLRVSECTKDHIVATIKH